MIAGLLIDFYGTIVGEDDAIVADICARVATSSPLAVTPLDIAKLWSEEFADECAASYGDSFKSQRAIIRASLARVLDTAQSAADPDELTTAQFAYWQQPHLYPDARAFLARIDIPVCVVSNIDLADIDAALDYHALIVDHVVTSEEVRSYKPRHEPFERAIKLLGQQADAVLHVGDSLSNDVAAGTALGIPVAWLNRRRAPRPRAPMLWADLPDLTTLAARIKGT